MVEQVPKRHFRYVSNVRRIVYNDIESFRRNCTSDVGEKCWVLLSALEYVNPSVNLEAFGKLTIDANDGSPREIVAPQFERAAAMDADLQKFYIFIDPWRQNGVVKLQITELVLVRIVSAQI